MIKTLSRIITNAWIRNGIISNDMRNVYTYGNEIIISTIISYMLIIGLGIAFSSFYHSLIFLFIFVPIRNYSGGYHADSYLKCSLAITSTFILVILCSKYLPINIVLISLTCILSVVLSAIFAPVENPSKPLNQREIKKFKLISILLLTFEFVICYIMYYSKCYFVAKMILYTIIAVVVLLIIGYNKNKRRINHEKDRESIHKDFSCCRN